MSNMNEENKNIEGLEILKDLEIELPLDNIGKEEIEDRREVTSDSKEIDCLITGDVVDNVDIKTDTVIEVPNYVIDLKGIEEMDRLQIGAIESLIEDGGDVALYLSTNGKFYRIGYASNRVHRVISIAITKSFDKGVRVYRDYEVGKKPQEVSKYNTSIIRLTI